MAKQERARCITNFFSCTKVTTSHFQKLLPVFLVLAALAFLVPADSSFFATTLFFAAAAAWPSLEHVVSGARPDGALLSRMN
jgi:hypothetical protein